MNAGVEAFDNGGSIMTPLERPGLIVLNFDYYLGADIYVAPIVRESIRPDVILSPLLEEFFSSSTTTITITMCCFRALS